MIKDFRIWLQTQIIDDSMTSLGDLLTQVLADDSRLLVMLLSTNRRVHTDDEFQIITALHHTIAGCRYTFLGVTVEFRYLAASNN